MNSRRDKISIIVPIYNVEQYLTKCLMTLCKQTYENIEIILVDDGSTDSCGRICDEFEKSDSRIKVIHKKNGGLVEARKTGLNAASGRYIGYVDGDDWIEFNMFERLYDVMTEQQVDIAMCSRFENTGEECKKVFHGLPQGRYNKKDLIEKVYPNMIVNESFFEWGIFPGVWDKLFKKELLIKNQMAVDNRITIGEDAACVYPCLLCADSIYVLQECLYHYRQYNTSMVKQNSNSEIMRRRFSILYNSVLEIFEKYKEIYDLSEQWKEYLLFLMVPRAETLYQGIERLDYLFPFPKVKKGSKIVLYGMGTYGQLLFHYIRRYNICEIVACSDRNFEELNKQGWDVIAPQSISTYQYDYIVIANSFSKVRYAIYTELCKNYPKNKIQVMDEELIKREESLKAFGLMEGETI